MPFDYRFVKIASSGKIGLEGQPGQDGVENLIPQTDYLEILNFLLTSPWSRARRDGIVSVDATGPIEGADYLFALLVCDMYVSGKGNEQHIVSETFGDYSYRLSENKNDSGISSYLMRYLALVGERATQHVSSGVTRVDAPVPFGELYPHSAASTRPVRSRGKNIRELIR